MSKAPDGSLRLTFVLPSLVPAGMETMALALARELTARGHRVSFVCVSEAGSLAGEALDAGIPVLVEGPSRRGSALCPSRLRMLLAETKPDVVHIHGSPWFKAALAARWARVPRTVHTMHGLYETDRIVGYLSMRAGAPLTDLVATVSPALAEYARRTLRVPADRVVVVRNGVDLAKYAPDSSGAFRREHGLLPTVPLVGVIARLAVVKDHATMLRAFARVRATLPEARLALIGDGPERERLRVLANELGLASHVIFCGVRRDLNTVLPDFDVVSLSSTAEGLPMALLEAMASERAVVATAVGGIPDLLRGGAGTCVPAKDPEALAIGLVTLLKDPAARRAMGRCARRTVEAHYSLAQMATSYERAYVTRPSGTVASERDAT